MHSLSIDLCDLKEAALSFVIASRTNHQAIQHTRARDSALSWSASDGRSARHGISVAASVGLLEVIRPVLLTFLCIDAARFCENRSRPVIEIASQACA